MCERPYETTKLDDRQNRLRDVARLGGLAKVYYRVIMPRRHGGLAAGDRIHNFSTGAVAVLLGRAHGQRVGQPEDPQHKGQVWLRRYSSWRLLSVCRSGGILLMPIAHCHNHRVANPSEIMGSTGIKEWF